MLEPGIQHWLSEYSHACFSALSSRSCWNECERQRFGAGNFRCPFKHMNLFANASVNRQVASTCTGIYSRTACNEVTKLVNLSNPETNFTIRHLELARGSLGFESKVTVEDEWRVGPGDFVEKKRLAEGKWEKHKGIIGGAQTNHQLVPPHAFHAYSYLRCPWRSFISWKTLCDLVTLCSCTVLYCSTSSLACSSWCISGFVCNCGYLLRFEVNRSPLSYNLRQWLREYTCNFFFFLGTTSFSLWCLSWHFLGFSRSVGLCRQIVALSFWVEQVLCWQCWYG